MAHFGRLALKTRQDRGLRRAATLAVLPALVAGSVFTSGLTVLARPAAAATAPVPATATSPTPTPTPTPTTVPAPGPPPAVALPVSAVGDEAAALQQAVTTKKPVEVNSEDTATSVTLVNPDGTQTKQMGAGPIRVKQGTNWVPVDTTLVAANGTVSPKAAPGQVTFSGGAGAAGGTLASVSDGTHTISYAWPAALPAPTLAGNQATYAGVVPNGDLVLTATPRGFEVSLLLRKAPASPLVLTLPLNAGGLHLAQAANGDLNLSDDSGTVVAHAPAPRMYTTALDPHSGLPTRTSPIASTLVQTSSGPALQLSPDQSWLTNPATTYPVVVDPSANLSVTLDDTVDSAYPTTNYDNGAELDVGTYNGGGSKNRSFIQFNNSVIKNQTVTGAQIHLYETYSYQCGNAPIYVKGAGGMGPGTTWNNQPGINATVFGNASFYGGYSGCPSTAGWKTVDITGLLQAWSTNGYPSPEALALVAPNETDNSQWKKFSSSNTSNGPYISVTYNPCTTYSSPATGSHQVCGAIRDKFNALGGVNAVGYPTTDESGTPDGYGRYNHFFQNSTYAAGTPIPAAGTSSIYFTAPTGAHQVKGLIRDNWRARGWESSASGYPVTDETATPDGVGRYNHFYKASTYPYGGTVPSGGNASIYYAPATGAHEVHGSNRTEWQSLGWETGVLGYPVGDEVAAPGGGGTDNTFFKNSTYAAGTAVPVGGNAEIDYSAATGSHEVHGPIEANYRSGGTTAGCLAFPTSDVTVYSNGEQSTFQHGTITHYTSGDTTTANCTVPPAAPTNAAATGGNAQATVTWTAPAANGGPPVTGYTVTASPGGQTATSPAGTTSATVTGLTNGTSYTFTVVATNSIGNSAPSAPSNAVTPALPDVPKVTTGIAGSGNALNLVSGKAAPGQTLTYTTTLTNVTPQTVTLTDPAAIGKPDGSDITISVNNGTPQSCASLQASCVINPPTGTANPGLTVSGLVLPANATVQVNYTAIAQGIARTLCQAIQPTAKVAATGGTGTATAVGTATSLCDSGLGLESWWSYLSRPVGPDGVANVNASNGNMVLQQLDSSEIQARGRLSYTLRRTYNSQDSTIVSLPGSLGAGWQYNFGEAGDTVGDGVAPDGLFVPSLASILNPLSTTLIDRDGTRHVFAAKLPAGTADHISGQLTSSLTGGVWQAATGSPSALLPQLVQTSADATKFNSICVDEPYAAPAGVHLGMWRYIATNATGANPCSSLTLANSAVIGFATERPDRLRSEYDLTGRLLSQTDGAGVQLNYMYYGGLPTAQLGAGNSPVNAGPLAVVYEPRSCSSTPTVTATSVTVPAGCRSYQLDYYGVDSTTGLKTGGLKTVVDPAGRTTSYAYSDINSGDAGNSPTRRLAKVTNPDSSTESYTYSGYYPAGGSAATAPCGADSGDGQQGVTLGQMCSATDPSGHVTRFTYTIKASDGSTSFTGLPHVATLTDRRGTPTSFSYKPDGSSTTSTDNPNGPAKEIRTFGGIDPAGRVADIQDADAAGSVLHRTTYSWDSAGGPTCEQPASKPRVDNMLCSTSRLQTQGDTSPATATDTVYNTDGYPLIVKRYDPASPSNAVTATSGYHVQYVDQLGNVTHYDDTPTGNGQVSSSSTDASGNPTSGGPTAGDRVDPTGHTTVFSVDDHTASLTPRGNAASPPGGYAAYETTWKVDAPASGDGGGFNTARSSSTTFCTGTGANTGLACEQHTPAGENNPTTCTEVGAATRGCDLTRFSYDTYGARTSMTSPKANAAGSTASTHYSYFNDGSTDLSGHTPAAGWLQSVTDPSGKFVAYGYDAAGNRTRVWDRNATDRAGQPASAYPGAITAPPSSSYKQTSYDPTSTVANPATDAHAMANPWRFVTASRDALGNSTNLSVDNNGNITARRAPRGTATGTASYDSSATYFGDDLLKTAKTPSGTTSYGYDPFGNRTLAVDENGHDKVTDYDAANRPVATRWTRGAYNGPAGSTVADCSPGRSSTAADGVEPNRILCATGTRYNSFDKQLTTNDAAGGQTDYTYDTLARPTAKRVLRSSGTYLWTLNSYDADGHVTDTCDPNGYGNTATTPTGCGIDTNHPNGSHVTYNAAGQVSTSSTYRAAGTAAMVSTNGHDADGNTVTTTDPRGAVTTTGFDLLGRKTDVVTQRSSTESHSTHYGYDPAGDPTLTASDLPPAATTAAGAVTATATAYDADNRKTDTVTGYTGRIDTPANLAADVLAATSSRDGGSNSHTRDSYDPDGNVVQRLLPRAFTAPATGASPDPRFGTQVSYDTTDRPTSAAIGRYDTADPAFADATNPASGTQAAQCPTGKPGWAATVGVCTTSVAYDPTGNPAKVTLPTSNGSDGRYIAYDYTDDHLMADQRIPAPNMTSTLSNGSHAEAPTTYTYDGVGRLLRQVDPGSKPDGSDAASFTTTNSYNADGSQASTTAPGNGSGAQTTSYGYDNAGQQTSVTDPLTGQQGRAAASTSYTADHLTATSTDTGGDKTSYTYDSAGNAATTVSPNGNTTSYTHTLDGLLQTEAKPANADGSSLSTSYSYDGAGQKTSADTSRQHPGGAADDPGPQIFSYYANGLAHTQTARHAGSGTAETITKCYDADGNPLEVYDNSDGTVPGCASTDGRTSSASSTGASHQLFGYYLDDTVRRSDDGSHPTAYSYDGSGQPTSRQVGTSTNPTGLGTTTYGYSDANQLVTAQDTRTGNNPWTRAYDHNGRPSTGALPNGNLLSWLFNPDGTVADQKQTKGSSTVEEHGYAYDQLRRALTDKQTTASGASTTDTYTYNAAGRLASFNDGKSTQYANWDKDGNRTCYGTSCNATPTPTDSYTYNPDDSLATQSVKTAAGTDITATVNYDGAGRRTSDGGYCYNYDGFDRNTATYAQTNNTTCSGNPSTNSPGVSYSYDGLDRQTSKTATANVAGTPAGTTTIGYDSNSTTQTSQTGPGGVTSWVLDNGAKPIADVAPSGTKYLVDDGHGNTVAETDPTGGLSCLIRYDPFGSPRNTDKTMAPGSPCDQSTDQPTGQTPTARATANDLLFHSQRRDANSGDYQLGARTYDPKNAAFTTPDSDRASSPDSQPGVGTDPLTANTYTYVNGDPINYVDPTGHFSIFGAAAFDNIVTSLFAPGPAAAAAPPAPAPAKKCGTFDLLCKGKKFAEKHPVITGIVAGFACDAVTVGVGTPGCVAFGAGVTGYFQSTKTCNGDTGCVVKGTALSALEGYAGARVFGLLANKAVAALAPKAESAAADLAANSARPAEAGGAKAAEAGGSKAAAAEQAPARAAKAEEAAPTPRTNPEAGNGRVTTAKQATEPREPATAGENRPTSCVAHSFAAGTLVVLADGTLKPISKLKVKDKVRTTDPATGQTVFRTITRLHHNHDHDLADLTVRDSLGRSAVVHTTQLHPFYDDTRHAFADTATLTRGDRLHSTNGTTVTVQKVHSYTDARWMYDLTIDQTHTYYIQAGPDPVLVHNCGDDILPTPRVGSTKLQNLVDNVYKGTTNPGRVGNGTTADAVRYESSSGEQVFGRSHTVKAEESVTGFKNWLIRNPDADYMDRVVARSVADDLLDALGRPQ